MKKFLKGAMMLALVLMVGIGLTACKDDNGGAGFKTNTEYVLTAIIYDGDATTITSENIEEHIGDSGIPCKLLFTSNKLKVATVENTELQEAGSYTKSGNNISVTIGSGEEAVTYENLFTIDGNTVKLNSSVMNPESDTETETDETAITIFVYTRA